MQAGEWGGEGGEFSLAAAVVVPTREPRVRRGMGGETLEGRGKLATGLGKKRCHLESHGAVNYEPALRRGVLVHNKDSKALELEVALYGGEGPAGPEHAWVYEGCLEDFLAAVVELFLPLVGDEGHREKVAIETHLQRYSR